MRRSSFRYTSLFQRARRSTNKTIVYSEFHIAKKGKTTESEYIRAGRTRRILDQKNNIRFLFWRRAKEWSWSPERGKNWRADRWRHLRPGNELSRLLLFDLLLNLAKFPNPSAMLIAPTAQCFGIGDYANCLRKLRQILQTIEFMAIGRKIHMRIFHMDLGTKTHCHSRSQSQSQSHLDACVSLSLSDIQTPSSSCILPLESSSCCPHGNCVSGLTVVVSCRRPRHCNAKPSYVNYLGNCLEMHWTFLQTDGGNVAYE